MSYLSVRRRPKNWLLKALGSFYVVYHLTMHDDGGTETKGADYSFINLSTVSFYC